MENLEFIASSNDCQEHPLVNMQKSLVAKEIISYETETEVISLEGIEQQLLLQMIGDILVQMLDITSDDISTPLDVTSVLEAQNPYTFEEFLLNLVKLNENNVLMKKVREWVCSGSKLMTIEDVRRRL